MRSRTLPMLVLAAAMLMASVAIPVSVSAQLANMVIDDIATSDFNLSPDLATWMSDHATDIPPEYVQTFRFGDDPTGEPTLPVADSPWLTPRRIGTNIIEWGAGTLPAVPGEGMQPNGDVWVTIGGGPKPDTPYIVDWAELDGPFPGPDGPELWQNFAFPTSIHDHEGWAAQGPFIGDTWQGAAFVPVLTYGPDPWMFDVQETVGGELVSRPDISGFGYVGSDAIVMAWEAGPVLGDSPAEMMPWLGVGFAAHSHDGNFGATPDGLSRVTAWPGDLGPRVDPLPTPAPGSERVLRVGFEPRVDPVEVWGVVDGSDGVWVDTRFAAPFGSPPPDDLFSVFVSFGVGPVGEPGSSVGGWSLHDGESEVTIDIPGATDPPLPEMYVAGDGSILWNTGLMVDDVFHGDSMVPLTIDSGFWPDEATTQARFATTMFELSAADLIHEDPFTHAGPPTWDLIGGVAVEVGDDTIPPDTSKAATSKPDTSEGTSDGGVAVAEKPSGSGQQDDGGSNTAPIVLIIGGMIVIIAGGFIWWRRRGIPGYGEGVRTGLGTGPVVPGGGVSVGPGTLIGPGTLVGPGTIVGPAGVTPVAPGGGVSVGPGTLIHTPISDGDDTKVDDTSTDDTSAGGGDDTSADDTGTDDGDDTKADDTSTDDTSTDDTSAGDGDDTSADDTSDDDGDNTGTSTDDTTDGSAAANEGVDYFGKRDGDQPKRDCSDLVAECRYRTDLAEISERQVEEAGERIDDLVAKLEDANSTHDHLEQRLADLVRHDSAPNQFERMAELQADIRKAQQRVRELTRDKQTAEEILESVKKEAASSRADAKKACKAAADCEAGKG